MQDAINNDEHKIYYIDALGQATGDAVMSLPEAPAITGKRVMTMFVHRLFIFGLIGNAGIVLPDVDAREVDVSLGSTTASISCTYAQY